MYSLQTTATTCGMPCLPMEIQHHIVDAIGAYRGRQRIVGLLVCALVSRSWRDRSQSLIFRDVGICEVPQSLDQTAERWPRTVWFAPRPFNRLMTQYPHLSRHLRSFCIASGKGAGQQELLSGLPRQLDHVQSILLTGFSALDSPSAVAFAVNFRSIGELTITRSIFTTLQGLVVVLNLFPNLEALCLSGIAILDMVGGPDGPVPPPQLCRLKRASLNMRHCAALLPWLASGSPHVQIRYATTIKACASALAHGEHVPVNFRERIVHISLACLNTLAADDSASNAIAQLLRDCTNLRSLHVMLTKPDYLSAVCSAIGATRCLERLADLSVRCYTICDERGYRSAHSMDLRAVRTALKSSTPAMSFELRHVAARRNRTREECAAWGDSMVQATTDNLGGTTGLSFSSTEIDDINVEVRIIIPVRGPI